MLQVLLPYAISSSHLINFQFTQNTTYLRPFYLISLYCVQQRMSDVIKKKIRDEIKKSSFSFSIHLCHCRLVDFPHRLIEAIPTLLNLRRLDLSSNNISEIPAEICGFVELRELWLQNNPITTLPKEIEHLTKIEVIDLKFTNITELPSEMCNLKKLFDLDFTETPFAAHVLQRYEIKTSNDHKGLQTLKKIFQEIYQRQCLANDTLEKLMGELYVKEADNPQSIPIVKNLLEVCFYTHMCVMWMMRVVWIM